MASYTPAAGNPKDGYPAHMHTPNSRPHLPVIPDLRFEYSYLRRVRPYVQIERSASASVVHEYERINIPGDQKETEGNDKTLSPTPRAIPASEIIHVRWEKIIWITVRDQVVSPLLQGALWALASYYITPFSARLGSKMRTFVYEYFFRPVFGWIFGWIRGWTKNLGLSNSLGLSRSLARSKGLGLSKVTFSVK